MDDDESSVNNNDDASVASCGLTKNDVIKLLFIRDKSLSLVQPEKFKSLIWERFRCIYYRGVKLNFVQCIGCNLVLVYKSRTGTASLLRHRCPSFPISVYELKLENQKHLLALAGHQLFSEMASSSNNGIVELKQEMLSEEDSMDHDEQQFSNDQTDEGLLQSFSLLEKSFMGSDDVLLSREEIESAYRNQDPDLFFERPRNHRHSSTWDRFEIVYYRDIRQNFAKCLSCSSIVSYKKTTGTASLIRHKCKLAKNHHNHQPATNSTTIKSESLINLLTNQQKLPAPTPVAQTSASSSSAVSSTITTTIAKPLLTVKSRSENVSVMDLAGKNVALAQINLLSQSMMSTAILREPTYLNFLQQLVNFGADYGKQKVGNFINQQLICDDLIPNRCDDVRSDLMKQMRGAEFSISYHNWTNSMNEQYVTVVGYFFTPRFEYCHKTLGTASCDHETMMDVIREISKCYRSKADGLIKCVGDREIDGFETFPCIIGKISDVIKAAMHANAASETFFNDLLQVISENLDVPQICDSNDDAKVKLFYKFHLHLKTLHEDNTPLVEQFNQLMGLLFSAITSLTKMSANGSGRSVTANEIYLWSKKLLKYYSTFQMEDDEASKSIRQTILQAIKNNFTNEIQELYKVAVFLDPNFKNLKFLDTSERNTLLDIVRKNLQNIINEDSDLQPQVKKQKSSATQSKSHLSETFLEFMDITMESVDDQVNSEIQCYMGFKLEDPVDIVEFWRTNDCFPYLKQLARNLLNLPSCTFHSDCCFLSAGHEFYQKCRNLPAEDVETLTFLHAQK